MKLDLTKNEMLALWKRRHFLEPLRADCRIGRSDGVDLDAISELQMRQWYLNLLAEAPVELVATTDLALTATLKRTSRGSGLVTLPTETVRVLSVKLSCWPTAVVPVEETSAEAHRQSNPYSRAGIACPVAVMHSNNTLELFSLENSKTLPSIDSLLTVADYGPDRYVMDERAWEWETNNAMTYGNNE